MNFQELKELINNISVFTVVENKRSLPSHFPEFNVVDSTDTYDDGNESKTKILHFTDGDLFIKVTGYYASYDRTHWDSEITQVFPKQKMITFYSTEQ